MKNKVCIIIALLGYIYFPSAVIAQEEQVAFEEAAEDDLGNVTDEFQEYFFEALKQKGIENYEKAITALQKCQSMAPNSAVVHFEMGKNYKNLEDYDAAIISFRKARELEPERESILVELYDTYSLNEDYENAIIVVKELIKSDSMYAENLVDLYVLSEKYDNALEVLEELDEEFGNNSYRNKVRRQIYARTNNIGAQIGDLEEGIEDDPENEQNYLNLIYIYSDMDNEEEAFQVAQDLLKANPSSTLVHLALYKFYLDKDNTEEAINSMKIIFDTEEIDVESKYDVLNDFLRYVNANPELETELLQLSTKLSEGENGPGLYEKLGLYYFNSERSKEALKYFELALKENPDNFELMQKALLLQLDFSKFEEASNLSEKALEIFPAQPIFYLIQGIALNELQEYSEAKETLTLGLDYLIENKEMELNFYEQLVLCYNGLNEERKSGDFQERVNKLKNEILDD